MRKQHLVKEGFACYYVIEPGDGTRYTAFYVADPDSDPDNMYIAVGPGQSITGGYLIRRSSVRRLAQRILDAAKDGKSVHRAILDDDYTGYWTPKLYYCRDSGSIWTVCVAVLFGLIAALSPIEEDTDFSIGFIGDVYNNRTLPVIVTLEEWISSYDSSQ